MWVPDAPSGDVRVGFVVADPEADAVDVRLELRLEADGPWLPATLASESRHSGLATSPDGVAHEIGWASLVDIGFHMERSVTLRLTPTQHDGRGASRSLLTPVLENLKAALRRARYPLLYYGPLGDDVIAQMRGHDLVVIHPLNANLTRADVLALQQGADPDAPGDDVIVLAYLSVGEDLRTVEISDDEMRLDPRFVGDGTGPRVDPRAPQARGGPLGDIDPLGVPSRGGTGYASWYLDDVSATHDPEGLGDGRPDRNRVFGGCFVNAGDPAWFDTLDTMTLDGVDGHPGLAEILTTGFGRGLGCDGVFLDTIDVTAPNAFTDADSPNQTAFEWTAPGMTAFVARLRAAYPTRLIAQNRAVFYFDPRVPHYAFTTRPYIDALLFESYRLDSNPLSTFDAQFFPDNRHNVMPKLMAEAGRPDGFRVFSLGYAEGPAAEMDLATLRGESEVGLETLRQDIFEAQNLAGFRHYITNGAITYLNDFVRREGSLEDDAPPVWSSTYNDHAGAWPEPPGPPTPRVGIQQVVPGHGSLVVRWDVALDLHSVRYALYRQATPFDFEADPNLTAAARTVLTPSVGLGYTLGVGPDRYPYETRISNLPHWQSQYMVIRGFDTSPHMHEDNNNVMLSGTPFGAMVIDGQFDEWAAVDAVRADPADADDGIPSAGPDWRAAQVAHDDQFVYIHYTSNHPFNLDGSPEFGFSRTLVFIDVDDDPTTGYDVGGGGYCGSELLVAGDELYRQAREVFNAGFVGPVAYEPTVQITDAELSISIERIRNVVSTARRLRIVLLNDEINDFMPDWGDYITLELIEP